MTSERYGRVITALLVIDPYNDFISEGGKIWPRIKAVAEANNCVPNMLEVLNAARKAKLRVFYAMHHRYRPGDYATWKYVAPIQRAAWRNKSFEYGTWGGEFRAEFVPAPGEIVAQEHWCSSGFANTDLDLQLKKQGIHQLIVIGLIAHTCIEATVRYAAELGYEVTVVKDATADYSDEMMHAALDINMPNYASAIVSTEEIVASISTTADVEHSDVRARTAETGKHPSMSVGKILIAAVLVIAIAAPIASFVGDIKVPQSTIPTGESIAFFHGLAAAPAANQPGLASLERADEWLNSPALTASALRGKVVLVHFWTYTCINWLRTQSYLRAWADKYKDKGLVVVGVHTPEFRFEKNIDNVRGEVKALRVDYPVAVDSNYVIWRAFNNNYWPAQYFIDAQGRVRHSHFGEGSYDQSEMVIQRLLMEAGAGDIGDGLVTVEPRGFEVAADWASLKSQENYVGYERTEGFASPGGAARDSSRMYEVPAQLRRNEWALSGDWTIKPDAAELNKPNGRIAYRFHARDLHLVMGPAAPGKSVKFRVLIDGQPPGAAHGIDIDEQGHGTVTAQRLHQLIRQTGPIADHQFEIEFLDPGVEAFCFTFG